MKPTSVRAYRDHVRSGAALTQQDRVFRFIDRHPGHTRLEISEATGIRINAVCGRVAALVKRGFVIEGQARRQDTGKPAAPLYVVEPPVVGQVELWPEARAANG